MNFIFWNIRKRTDELFLDSVVKMLNENDTDIFMVAELPGKDIERVKGYINNNTGGNYKHINGHTFEKVVIFAKRNIDIQLKDVTSEGKRTVRGEDFSFFYNPMWCFWGDCGRSDAPGTYYMDGSGRDIALFWHILDQVIIRKGLIDFLDSEKLNIITEINGVKLLNDTGRINSSDFSDHLPISFCLNI